MSPKVPANPGDAKIEALLEVVRRLSQPRRSSWLSRVFQSGVSWSARQQTEFNAAVVEALNEIARGTCGACARLAEIEEQVAAFRPATEHFREDAIRQAEAHAAELEAIRCELRERLQHVLDEQRVCLRQVSLRTSEEAILADRARRATELRLEELTQRVAQPDSGPST